MWKKQAERFEASLQQATRGESPEEPYGPLVKTANSVATIHVPPPPRGLVEGRRQLVAEASELRWRPAAKQSLPLFAHHRMRLVPVLASLLLVVALLPLFTQEVAASLPGSSLYGLKLLAQDIHLWMTSSPDAMADLDLSLAERRLNDVATALEQGQNIDDAAAASAEKQLLRAVQTVAENPETAGAVAPLQLMDAIQNCERVMIQALNRMSESDQLPLRDLLREMERARRELHSGSGTAHGEQERAQYGEPPGPEEMPWSLEQPDPGWRWLESPGQGSGEAASGQPGQPAQASQQQQGPAGSAEAAQTPPASAPVPEPTPAPAPEQPQQNAGQQQGPGNNDPHGNSSPANKNSSGHSGHP